MFSELSVTIIPGSIIIGAIIALVIVEGIKWIRKKTDPNDLYS